MPSLIRIAVLLALACVTAHAAPPRERIVVADPDPELQRALENTLAPWRLEIIYQATAPADTREAEARANAQAARFVIWRRKGDLVVFDRERGAAEHRDGTAGVLDPASAAAAALTVKTLMRLPPPPPENDIAIGSDVTAPQPAPDSGPELRTQAGIATRVARGSETNVGARVEGAVLVRPWARRAWRFGLAGDLGTKSDVRQASFKGTWSDWALFAVASWAFERGPWEIEPHAAVGFTRSRFEGIEMATIRSETAMLGMLRGGAWIRWRSGRWSTGGSVDLDGVPGTPTYIKLSGNGTLFSVPSLAFALGVFVAGDLGR
jgi:hypothetical protein